MHFDAECQMLLTYSIDAASGIITITGDEPTPEQFEDHLRRLFADPRYRPGYGWLRDRRHLPAPSTEYISHTVRALSQWPGFPGCRIALVVPESDPAHYGMMRMVQLMGDGRALEAAIFFDVDSARAWLIETRDRELA
jgi:hypothetical protein